MAKLTYAVVGMGTFGRYIALELKKCGNHVVICDRDANLVKAMDDLVDEPLIIDVSDEEAVKTMDVKRFDAVILCMSSSFENQILALDNFKNAGAKKIYAKAINDTQKNILSRLGADKVWRPEIDFAKHQAEALQFDPDSDFTELRNHIIATTKVPKRFYGKMLKESDLRRTYRITVLLVRVSGSLADETPGPDTMLREGDSMVIFGPKDNVKKFFVKEEF